MAINDDSKPNLVHFCLPFLLAVFLSFCFWIIDNIISENTGSPMRYGIAIFLPLIFAGMGYRKKSLDYSGLFAAVVVGFMLTISNYCFSTSLIAFFFTASSATKFRSHKKRLLEDDFKEGGQRTWIQVICNGGIAAQIGMIYAFDVGLKEVPVNFMNNYNASWLSMSVLGALACSCGDTFASELGPVLCCSQPRLITTFKKVEKGTNGGVSVAGLVASALGGFVVGVTYYLTLLLTINHRLLYKSPPQWPIVLQGISCGFIGSLIDSFLGATVQFSGYDVERHMIVESPGPSVKPVCGRPLLSNHSVNFASAFFTAVLSPFMAYYLWQFFN